MLDIDKREQLPVMRDIACEIERTLNSTAFDRCESLAHPLREARHHIVRARRWLDELDWLAETEA
jgi:hypothetical protein